MLSFALQKLFHGYGVYMYTSIKFQQHNYMEYNSPFAVIAKETINNITKAELKTDLTLRRLLSFIGSETAMTPEH